MSTTLHLIDGEEDLAHTVSRRVRGRIAELNMSKAAFARVMGMNQQNMSRRLLGQTPFTLHELGEIARALGTSIAYLTGETNDPRPGNPDGGVMVRPQGLEPRTR